MSKAFTKIYLIFFKEFIEVEIKFLKLLLYASRKANYKS